MNANTAPEHAALQTQAAALVQRATGETALRQFQPLRGGGNNQVFRLELPTRTLLLKCYFHHAHDPRDRLSAEFAFARFAWAQGLRCLPEALAADPLHHLGLYEFVTGRMPQPEDLNADRLAEALTFYLELNRHKLHPTAALLPSASEACFTLAEHLARVEARIAHLHHLETPTVVDAAAAAFVRGPLATQWQQLATYVQQTAATYGLDLTEPLAQADRCLSPSDFGFHNAVLAADNRLRFIDFEYAGWDDPAKLVGDFFCQPAVPVPLHFFAAFAEQVAQPMHEPRIQRARIGLLLPVYQLKWCCIMLNDFLPVGSARRRFARTQSELAQRKPVQLAQAQAALQRVPMLCALAAEVAALA